MTSITCEWWVVGNWVPLTFIGLIAEVAAIVRLNSAASNVTPSGRPRLPPLRWMGKSRPHDLLWAELEDIPQTNYSASRVGNPKIVLVETSLPKANESVSVSPAAFL